MVSYYTQDIDFTFKNKAANNQWLKVVAESEIRRLGQISIIFCSDNYILDINMKYLQHDYFTDIITFDYCKGDNSPATCSSALIASGRTPASMMLIFRKNCIE